VASDAPAPACEETVAVALREPPGLLRVREDDAHGFAKTVWWFVAVPLIGIGVLATLAGVAVGQVGLALGGLGFAIAVTWALRSDTRLEQALEWIHAGRVDEAEQALRAVARARHRGQRERARALLVELAWRRGDLPTALAWSDARLADASAASPFERWSARATAVQLLALNGRTADARAALARLGAPPGPPSRRAAMGEATTRLLVAFAADDADLVRHHVDGWDAALVEADDLGLTTALVAWGLHACGRLDRARLLIERTVPSRAELQARAPALVMWIDGVRASQPYGRG
jgi:hypothetical protein